jgi:hypothetical protein
MNFVRSRARFLVFALLVTALPAAAQEFIERLDDFLAVSAFHGNVRARLSGTIDLEGYYIQQPAPGLLFTDRRTLLNPRLSLFLDAQVGSHIYAFAQMRVDRGFDPERRDGADVRLDEFALRISPWDDGRFSVQVGKFATVVGNWVERHDSWENPFVTAPLPYENTTGIWDIAAPGSSAVLLDWAHIPFREGRPGDFGASTDGFSDKYLRAPIIWGPNYASGISVAGRIGKFDYAAEVKNASLSSRPESWDINETGLDHPTVSGRLGFRPNEMWNFGVSASAGAYMLPEAESSLPPGRDLGDYQQLVLAQDIRFAWRHLQIWAEFYQARFEVPLIGDADTFAYYIEAKYKFTPQFFGALRWNQQLFGTIPYRGADIKWGNDIWRVDAAITYRLTTHMQFKLQYSLQNEENAPHEFAHNFAGQFTVRF